MTAPTGFAIRPGADTDKPYVYSTLLVSFRAGGWRSRDVDKQGYFSGHHALIDGLFVRGAQLTVCCPEDDADTIAGYCLWEPGVLHYVLTREVYRRAGIAAALLKALSPAPDWYTHRTRDFAWLEAKLPCARFHPYLLSWPYDAKKRHAERESAKDRPHYRRTPNVMPSRVNGR